MVPKNILVTLIKRAAATPHVHFHVLQCEHGLVRTFVHCLTYTWVWKQPQFSLFARIACRSRRWLRWRGNLKNGRWGLSMRSSLCMGNVSMYSDATSSRWVTSLTRIMCKGDIEIWPNAEVRSVADNIFKCLYRLKFGEDMTRGDDLVECVPNRTTVRRRTF